MAAGKPTNQAGTPERLPLYVCQHCGHGFSPLDVAPRELAAWYEESVPDELFLAGEPERRMTARAVLRRTGRRQPPGSLLDVGAGPGIFVSEARRAGWGAVGLEPAAWAVQHGRTQLGVPMIRGVLTDQIALETFDVLTLFDVIEHVADPGALLQAAAGRLGAGGLLVLTTPRFDSLLARCLGRRWYCIFPAHLHYFTAVSLRLTLAAAGLAIVEQRSHTRYVSARYYWQRLCSWLGWGVGRRVPSLLGRIPLPVNLGDEFEVYARRR